MPTSCKIARSSTLQFPDSHKLNHRIMAGSFVLHSPTFSTQFSQSICIIALDIGNDV
jgi:hypothetical protein